MNLSTHSPTIRTRHRDRAAAALTLAVVSAAAAVAAPARADYGPGAEAASANGTLLGDRASSSPSISDDGRYVALRTLAVNILGRPPSPGEAYAAGLVRRDMVTGAVELVAPPGRIRSDGTVLSPDPLGGSISGNGRYVLFDTTEALTSGDQNASSDVYVRDMSRPLTDGSAYELVSALDGTDAAPDYLDADRANGSRSGRRGFAISDDGRRAVFQTTARSSLPSPAATLAPPGQVLVRLLDTRQTLLVTRNLSDGKPVAPAGSFAASPNPVLSGDGSAVAWVAANAAAQTPLLRGEPPVAAVLWRDIAAGPGAPTRRVAGTSDPDDPGCPPGAAYPSGGNTASDPCFGPFAVSEVGVSAPEIGDLGISDDGRRLLFLTPSQQRPFDQATAGNIAYLADMAPGLTRKRGVRRILRGLDGQQPDEPTLAGGGTRLAFTSRGSVFEGPRSVGSFPAGAFPPTNVYVMDLEQGIVQRATVGADGTDLRGLAVDPEVPGSIRDPRPAELALSDDAGAIAFAAFDANLFLGDANDASDVQVVRGTPGVSIPRSAFTAPAPPPVTLAGGELLRSLRPLPPVHPVIGYLTVDRRGVARLTVRVPAAGRVSAIASAPARGRRLPVARTSRRPKGAATVHLRLVPTPAARKAARRARRLRVRIDVRYTPIAGRSTSAVRRYTLTGSARP